MMRLTPWIYCLVVLLFAGPATLRAEVTLGTDSFLLFASRQAASQILATDDEYTSRMSQFDRMLRLKSTRSVSPARYFEHMARNALDWTSSDKARLAPLLRRLSRTLDGYRLPLPPTVLLVKTTGNEEVGEGHTRANAIVLPQHSLSEEDETLFFLLAHELFHVMTRHDARFRSAAYALVGFRIGPEIDLPAAISPLQITNPDAPRHDSFIEVRSGGQAVEAVPVLYPDQPCSTPRSVTTWTTTGHYGCWSLTGHRQAARQSHECETARRCYCACATSADISIRSAGIPVTSFMQKKCLPRISPFW